MLFKFFVFDLSRDSFAFSLGFSRFLVLAAIFRVFLRAKLNIILASLVLKLVASTCSVGVYLLSIPSPGWNGTSSLKLIESSSLYDRLVSFLFPHLILIILVRSPFSSSSSLLCFLFVFLHLVPRPYCICIPLDHCPPFDLKLVNATFPISSLLLLPFKATSRSALVAG